MAEPSLPPLVVIVGPTAVGKTAAALEIARATGGEIISADSRQVYRYMDIGTAKPTPEERQLVPHHLVDFLDPDEELTLAQFQRMAYAAIDRVRARGRLPLLVGGTGQYVRAVVEGWGIPHVPPQPELRADLESFADVYGPPALYAHLVRVDPQAAEAIDWRNVRRVVRALEVYLITGQPISQLQKRTPPPYRILQIGLTRPRPALYARVDERVDRMIENGLVEEVRRLLEMGYSWDLPALSSLGYAQIGEYLRGEVTLEEAIAAIKRETRRFIRQQYTWFRPDDPAIRWFDLEETPVSDVVAFVQRWLG
ncbi:MAG TPA: tRNA (adenosine(37)-N6)-dimethylallyltransferase MiaA [Chloroflexi bacterium]|nr:tRNA (adenosine(37)-N6)-dimethylallyltransferase MiaA [Chloroflexota bacterium]